MKLKLKEFFINNQQTIVLVIGYFLVAGIAFMAGQITASTYNPPEIKIETAFAPLNNSPVESVNQSGTGNNSINPAAVQPTLGDCTSIQIKGNIGSSGSKVYHMPGGSFYNRTKAEACFNSEDEAKAAGFRKSSN
ncbi:MAG: hypothetical protein KW793_02290 [Candidatus Doudnabacteria bacterium]|nr:hypothetical protein [Candidatus Doudnabacteria bacterium]